MPSSTRKARPRRPLSRDRVLNAALKLADKNGIDALSMRKLADQLGVEAMSLYNHVQNKEDILDGIVDLVASEFEPPAIGGDWKQAMRRRATSAHEALLRHPWATQLLVSRVTVGPAMLRYVNATIGCLKEAGFSWAMADHAWNAVDSHIYGYTLIELNFPFQPSEFADVAGDLLEQMPMDDYPYLNGLALEVIAGRHDGLQDFDLALNLLLDGLDALREGS